MNIQTGQAAKTLVDIAKNENALDKATGLMRMLFPYVGVKQKAVDMYIKDIEQSNLPTETKTYMLLNIKKEFKKIKNQKAIAEIAIENMKEETILSPDNHISEEWFDRFMDSAGFVSSEEIQLIWGKILANEFERPGSTPPNLTRILSEITTELAKAFICICSMSIRIMPLYNDNIEELHNTIMVPYKTSEKNLLDLGLTFRILNELETLGVIKFNSVSGYIMKGIDSERVLICVGDKLDVVEKYNKCEFPIGNVILTAVGESLFSIIERIEINGYYEMVKNYMKNNGVEFANEHNYEIVAVNDESLKIRKR